jgi:hypothetical protein
MDRIELTGALDHARIVLTAIERLIDGKDAEASLLVIDLRDRLTTLADALEDGEIEG